MKILLGVCGSIACYKSYDLLRELQREGHEVGVVLTEGALRFLKADCFQYLEATFVLGPQDDFNVSLPIPSGPVNHISLEKWSDVILIAPLSANTLARLATGSCSDLLSSILLCRKKTPLLLVPAMNPEMFSHPMTQANLETLRKLPSTWNCLPDSGETLCGAEGVGRFPEIETVCQWLRSIPLARPLNQQKVLIAAGASLARLDPVRYFTTASSGMTGVWLSESFLKRGAQVTLLAPGPLAKKCTGLTKIDPENQLFSFKSYENSEELFELVQEHWPHFDLYISPAAVSDLKFHESPIKLKKSDLNQSLGIGPAKDILQWVCEHKHDQQKVVGFAAETELSENVIQEKWNRKPVDVLVGTQVGSGRGFGQPSAQYLILENKIFTSFEGSKQALAEGLAEKVLHWQKP